jgi:hypothetical protein
MYLKKQFILPVFIFGLERLTHNTIECRKNDKDGNPVVVATVKPSNSKKPFKKRGNKPYLVAAIESLVKKGLKKAATSKKRKRCSYDSFSSDSISE